MVLRDLIGDVFRTLWSHKLRTFLTMFGIAWGIVSIVLMVVEWHDAKVALLDSPLGGLRSQVTFKVEPRTVEPTLELASDLDDVVQSTSVIFLSGGASISPGSAGVRIRNRIEPSGESIRSSD